MTKTDIKNEVKRLELHGYEVLTANAKKGIPIALRGLCDHLCIGSKLIWWEVKIGADRASRRQELLMSLMQKLSDISGGLIVAEYLTEKDYKEKVDKIIREYYET